MWPFTLCSVSILITPQSSTLDRSQSLQAPATFSGHFLTGYKGRYLALRPPQGSTHSNFTSLQPYILQVKKTGVHMEWGLSMTSTIRPGYTVDSLPPAPGSASWHCHPFAYTWTAYISGLRNIPGDKFILTHKAYLFGNSIAWQCQPGP